jgi:hypothetical protein
MLLASIAAALELEDEEVSPAPRWTFNCSWKNCEKYEGAARDEYRWLARLIFRFVSVSGEDHFTYHQN